ncbi:hypothetical protein J2X31_002343 [Flavobacterium arsenatis]|uniref:Peptidylprolyl isomerase n=1 Tax=Flavobacterium arsenatis TaxID=1484332 RepID=A0ABU1TQU0_9FLAO|nr:hypothetical protein [Flavobacterium arsenatis]MDR6968326.1 hypothetical protein [Flavobacterium arsenatis]
MNKFRLYFTLLLTSVILFSCNKNDDDASVAPPRDFAEQYATDIDLIEKYLKTHSLVKVEVNGLIDVVIDSIPEENPQGLISIWDNTEFPLQSKIIKNDSRASNLVDGVSLDPVEYKMYYVMLSEGVGEQATTVDSTFVTYRGWRLDNTQFEVANIPAWFTYPAITANEVQSVPGFRQFISLLKKGDDPVIGPDGSIIYSNYGSGVVFIPSGLGYFNRSTGSLPAYSPIVFTLRLHAIRERDHDRDGILTKYERLNSEDPYTVDTDGDGIPDFLDVDDDGDGFLTRVEIKNAAGVRLPYDEVPTCPGGSLKLYLDPSCHKIVEQ